MNHTPMKPDENGCGILTDETSTVYDETKGQIFSFLLANGKTCYGNETMEQVRANNPKSVFRVLPFIEAKLRSDEMAKKVCGVFSRPVEITEEKFMGMLEVLPPEKWVSRKGWQAFRMCEYTTGRITQHYLQVGKRYFTAAREVGEGVYEALYEEIKAIIKAEKDAA